MRGRQSSPRTTGRGIAVIWKGLERHLDLGLLIVRIGFGLGFFWFHGWPKLTAGPERWSGVGGAMGSVGIHFAPEWWGLGAAIIESVGGLLIVLGLFFRPAALALATVMLVAMTNHISTGRGSPAHAFKNTWLFAGLFLVGPGRYSVDHLLASRFGRPTADVAAATD